MKGSREFLTSNGEPENQEFVKEIERFHLERYEKEQSGELKELLNSINFSVLESEFSLIAEKSRMDKNKFNFIGREKIFNLEKDRREGLGFKRIGMYDPGANCLAFDIDGLVFAAKDNNFNKKDFFLYLVCHEEAHATAKTECVGLSEFEKEKEDSMVVTTGYSKYFIIKDVNKKVYDTELLKPFNEGITEKIAREALDSYFKKTGISGENFKKRLENGSNSDNLYGYEVSFVDTLIKRISVDTGVLEIDVWNAFKRGFYNGEDLLGDRELREFWKGMFGEEFIKDLTNSKEGRHLFAIQERIKNWKDPSGENKLSKFFKEFLEKK